MRRGVLPFLLVAAFVVIRLQFVYGQAATTCPALVRSALTTVAEVCAGTGRNQICYGHSLLVAEPHLAIGDTLLNTPGDITEITNISRVRLFPMNVEMEQWGVALLRVQANLPTSLPGQNTLFMVFGDVELTPQVPSSELASASESVVLARQPVRAFQLRTGIGAPQCDSVPPDGLLIQTPHGVGRVELTLNGVDVSLGSTVFFRIEQNNLIVSTVEGSALLSAAGGESLALAGSEVQIPLDANLEASAPPLLPLAYDPEVLERLPLASLDRAVEVHPPLTQDELTRVQQAILSGNARDLLASNPSDNRSLSGILHSRAAGEISRDQITCPGNSCNSNGAAGNGESNNGNNSSNGNGGDCPGNSCNSNGSGNSGGDNGNNGNNGNGNGGNNPNGNGGDCPGNSCNSNGAAGNSGNGNGNGR